MGLRRHLSAANVLAALALFVALGGASYAVVALPRNSVGPRQLRPAAVTPPKLGFGLGAASSQDSATVPSIYCPPGALCPAIAFAPREIGRVSLALRHRADALVMAVVTAAGPGDGGTVRLDVQARIGNRFVPATPVEQSVEPGRSVSFPFQVLLHRLSAGTRDVSLVATASGNAPGGLSLPQVSLTVVALPAG